MVMETALLSFFTIFMQVIILNSLVNDTSNPTCSMHDACQKGMLCDGFDIFILLDVQDTMIVVI